MWYIYLDKLMTTNKLLVGDASQRNHPTIE